MVRAVWVGRANSGVRRQNGVERQTELKDITVSEGTTESEYITELHYVMSQPVSYYIRCLVHQRGSPFIRNTVASSGKHFDGAKARLMA